ncbi:hypothetical protein ACB094_08G079200 [Castanea mollissima]
MNHLLVLNSSPMEPAMAASPNNELSPIETLNSPPSTPPQMDGHESTTTITTTATTTITTQSQLDSNQEPLSNPESSGAALPPLPLPVPDEAVSGEKRKREEELPPLWKTSLCSYFRRDSGSCSHGDACKYAHGEEELRPRPDNTWDPTSDRAKKAMRSETTTTTTTTKKSEVCEAEIMMTEALIDDNNNGGGGGCLDPELSKCLVHLPRKWNSQNLTSFLGEQGVQFKSVKKKKGMTVGFVTFENTEQLKTAQEELKGKSIGNKILKVADVIPRSFDKKIRSTMALPLNGLQTGEPSLDVDGSVASARSVRDVVTPLAHMPYSDQLEHKKTSLMQNLKKLTRNARKACPHGVSLPEWILKSREIGGLSCKLEGILESPLVNGYRNKCEFSVGYSLQGKATVGFMLGNFREGVTAVEEPVDCPNVSRIACKYASIFQDFLQQSELPIWNRFKNIGFWRQLTVREGRTPGKVVDVENSDASISEVMLIVQVCSVGLDDAVVTGEFERLAQSFAAGAIANSPSLPLTALVVQDHQGISNAAPADAPLRQLPIPKAASAKLETNDVAEARIRDTISNLQFCISPTAFFQVNTLAAEKLYSLAGDWAGLGPDTLLFDVCCGTGTIGLTLAHRVGMVIGIEMNASAVSDAYRNAEINGIKNCKFVCAKAEDVMGSLLKEYLNVPQKPDEISNTSENSDKENTTAGEKDTSIDAVLDPEESSSHDLINNKKAGSQLQKNCTSESGNTSVQQFKNVVAIVDPPRVGLHPIVSYMLDIYISCNPESLVANAIELCTPSPESIEKGNKNNRGWRNMSGTGLARHRAKTMPPSEPFQPVKAMAVDLFPHTVHCELVMLLER